MDYQITINYPEELLWALQQAPEELAMSARLTLAISWYENGKLTTGLAAKLAGVPRSAFLYLLGQHQLSAFGETPDELTSDLENARNARHFQ